MKTKNTRKAGFTLVEIMIVVAIIGLLAAIAIPNFVKARDRARSNTCVANLKQIQGAIQQWALEGKKAADSAVTIGDIWVAGGTGFITGTAAPTCPVGSAAYTLVDVATAPVCANVAASVAGCSDHVLP